MDTFTARWTRTRLYPVLVLSLGRTQRKWTFQRNREVASLCNAVCLWNNVPRWITSSSPLFLLLVPLWYTKVYAIMSSLVQTRENRMASIPSSIPVQVFWVFNMVLINIVLFVVIVYKVWYVFVLYYAEKWIFIYILEMKQDKEIKSAASIFLEKNSYLRLIKKVCREYLWRSEKMNASNKESRGLVKIILRICKDT